MASKLDEITQKWDASASDIERFNFGQKRRITISGSPWSHWALNGEIVLVTRTVITHGMLILK